MIFKDKEQCIIDKKPFWGRVVFQKTLNWNNVIEWMNVTPKEKLHFEPKWNQIQLRDFHKNPKQPAISKAIISELTQVFYRNKITNLAFIGLGKESESFGYHADGMDVFLVQVLSDMSVKVEGYDTKDFIVGDCVYIPRGTHHKIMPYLSRVTFSFGIEGEIDPSTYIKTYK